MCIRKQCWNIIRIIVEVPTNYCPRLAGAYCELCSGAKSALSPIALIILLSFSGFILLAYVNKLIQVIIIFVVVVVVAILIRWCQLIDAVLKNVLFCLVHCDNIMAQCCRSMHVALMLGNCHMDC